MGREKEIIASLEERGKRNHPLPSLDGRG